MFNDNFLAFYSTYRTWFSGLAAEKSVIGLNVPVYVILYIPLASFKYLSRLFLSISLHVNIFVFILYTLNHVSCTCGFMSLISSGKFSFYSQIFYFHLFILYTRYLRKCICCTFPLHPSFSYILYMFLLYFLYYFCSISDL